jgi:hypothetical protein
MPSASSGPQRRRSCRPVAGASAWLRWRHGAGRPGHGHSEALALLAGANRAGGWGIFHPCKKVRVPQVSNRAPRTERGRPMQIAVLRTQTSAEPSAGSDLTGSQMSAGFRWDC